MLGRGMTILSLPGERRIVRSMPLARPLEGVPNCETRHTRAHAPHRGVPSTRSAPGALASKASAIETDTGTATS